MLCNQNCLNIITKWIDFIRSSENLIFYFITKYRRVRFAFKTDGSTKITRIVVIHRVTGLITLISRIIEITANLNLMLMNYGSN